MHALVYAHFRGRRNIVEFDPTGPDDEDVAQQESIVLNHMVTQRGEWDVIARQWCQDACITKNAYCLAFMDKSIQVEKEVYEGQTEEQLALLLQDDLEIIGHEQREDPDNPQPVIDPLTGQPAIDELGQPLMQPGVLYDVEVKHTKEKQKLQFRVLPPERCKVGQDTPDFTLRHANFFEYWDLETVSDLRKMGFEIDEDISDDVYTDTQEDISRDEQYQSDMDIETTDPSMRRVKVRTIWIRFDYDEDGFAELQKVVLVGQNVLDRQEVNRIPVACIVPFMNTHRHIGASIADLVFDIQRINAALLTGWMDSLYAVC